MNTINNKLKLVVAISIALGLSACSENKTAQEYVAAGQEFVQARDYAKAIIELKNAVKLAPQDAQARLLLGLSYLQQGNYLSAEKELSKALEFGIELAEIAEPLVQVMSKLNNYEDVYKFVDEAGTLSADQYVVVLTFAGISAINQNDIPKATDYLKQTISLNQKSPYTALAKAYLSYVEQQFDTSLTTARELVSASPDLTEALLLEGYSLMALKDFANASLSFAHFLERHPQAGYVKLLEINSLISSGDLDSSQIKVDQLLSVYKEAPLLKQFKAQIAFTKKDYLTASEFAEKAINSGLDYQYTRLIAGVSAYKLDNYESAYQHLRMFADKLNADSEFQRLYTYLQLKLGHEVDALDSIEKFDSLSDIDSDLYAETAMQLARAGDITKAKYLLSKANDLDENNAVNLLREGMLKLQSADISGVTELEKAIQNDMQVSNAWLTIALAHLQNNDVDKALHSAEKWQEISPEDGWALKGVIYFRVNKMEQAVSALKKALEINPDHLGAQMNLIRVSMRTGANDVAINEAKNILAKNPDSFKAMVILINLMHSEDKLSDAKAFMQAHMQANPSLISAKIAMAIVHRFNNQPEEAINLLVPEKDRLNTVGWRILGDSQLHLRKYNEALNTFTQWKDAQKNVVDGWLKMIATLDLLNQNEKAYDTIQAAEVVFKSHPQLLMLKLYYQTKLGFLADASSTLSTIKATNLSPPLLERLEGELALVNQDLDTAEQLLYSYYEKSPSMDSAELLAQVLKSKGKIKEAGELLKSEFEVSKKTFKGLFVLASFFSQTKQYDQSASYYLKVLEYRPENIIALNNLALIKLQQNKLDEAHIFATKAFKIAPSMPEVLDTLGWIEVQMNNEKIGLVHLEKAYKAAPNAVDIKEHYQQAKKRISNK